MGTTHSMRRERGEGWIQTLTGRRFYPLEPRVEDVDILDIAHALAMKCRYGGHSTAFYSVAQHSVLISQNVMPHVAMWALLHDAEEAYLADIPRPVKEQISETWSPVAKRVQDVICERFGLPLEEPASVKRADTMILNDEMRVLMINYETSCGDGALGIKIEPWTWQRAEREFLDRFIELGGEV